MGPTDALPGLSYSVFLTWKLTYRAACSDNLLELPVLIVYLDRYEHERVATVPRCLNLIYFCYHTLVA